MTGAPDLVATTVARLRAAGCVRAEDEAALLLDAAGDDAGQLESLVARREAGEPLEHVVGWAEIAGVRVVAAPGVFVPRHRTEHLATQALALAADVVAARGSVVVVDLCCGSGAVAAVVLAGLPARAAQVHAADVDPVAVDCARRTLAGTGAEVHVGDLDAALPDHLRGRVDVLVANVPYVPSAAVDGLPREARHEPRLALDGGADGLDLVRRVAACAGRWLAPGGHVLVEVADDQADAALAAFTAAGLVAQPCSDDDGTTAVVGRA